MNDKIYTIRRVHERRGNHFNSPMRYEWRCVGRVRAESREVAMSKAERITGASKDYLHVSHNFSVDGHKLT